MLYERPSTNFSTIFFLVFLFIGTGLLIYYAFEITLDNRQLKETIATLQTNVATLQAEKGALEAGNATLITENESLTTENATLTDEINRLKNALEQALTENSILTASSGGDLAELDNLRLENTSLRIALQQYTRPEASLDVLESTVLPTNPEFWVKIAAVIPIGAILLAYYALYSLRKKAAARNRRHTERDSSRRSRTTEVIDSHFIHR